MPDLPPDSSYAGYIIATLVAAVVFIWGILMAVIKYVESIFRTRISSLEAKVVELEKETKECEKTKFELIARIAALEVRVEEELPPHKERK
jgi:F0F1-type ATP synthase membrane subunit b/b'